MVRMRSWIKTHKLAFAGALVVTFIAMYLAMIGVATATDQPAFCRGACHEMKPYHAAWQEGPHAQVGCVECHVDAGTMPRVAHKVQAMKEVWSHLTTEPAFPLTEVASIPNERCLRCHQNPTADDPNFDHAAHANNRQCQDCHSKTGHDVSKLELIAAGVFNAQSKRVNEITTPIATVGSGKANVAGHVAVSCTGCHDMAVTGCSTCHEAQHSDGGAKKLGPCSTCHTAGAQFAFEHPKGMGDCASCHEVPASEHAFEGECLTCHTSPGASWEFTHTQRSDCTECHKAPPKHRPGACTKCHAAGKDWVFDHPGSSANCTSCHSRPANHRAGACTTCHATGGSFAFRHPASNNCSSCHARPSGHKSGACSSCHKAAGKTWRFSHPGRGSNCSSCHPRPSGHKSGACSKCHIGAGKSWKFTHPGGSSKCSSCHPRPSGHKSGACSSCHTAAGKSWKFTHPGGSSKCSSCHPRPSGHKSGACSSCHKAGSSWKFTHTSRGDCRACHKAPSNHYGSSCASCHQPGRAWSKATFKHPRVPGGEHTYRSFACSKCHPSGYSSHNCTSCHDSEDGDDDDDDDD